MSTKVLVVDDSATVRSLHSYIMKSNGFGVETASNGMEALEKLYSDKNIGLVVVDINMPKMDGLEFTRTVRKEKKYRDLPIVIVTSENESQDHKKGVEAGANIYMAKPTKPNDLVLQVKMLLGK